jgi:serine/threonine-protein kinase
MSVVAGQVLSHYRLVSPLGAGGMGEVWLAEDATLKRKVALKLLPVAVATDPDRLARFQPAGKKSVAQLMAEQNRRHDAHMRMSSTMMDSYKIGFNAQANSIGSPYRYW